MSVQLPALMPAFMTTREYAVHRGISRQAIQDARRRGLIVRHETSRLIDVLASDALWESTALPRSTSSHAHVAGNGGALDGLLSRAAPSASQAWPGSAVPDAPGELTATQSLNAERARKMAADAQIAELKLGKLRGDLLDSREAGRVQFAVIRTLRNRLRAIPSREAALLAQLKTAHALRHRLTELIDEALRIDEQSIIDDLNDEVDDG